MHATNAYAPPPNLTCATILIGHPSLGIPDCQGPADVDAPEIRAAVKGAEQAIESFRERDERLGLAHAAKRARQLEESGINWTQDSRFKDLVGDCDTGLGHMTLPMLMEEEMDDEARTRRQPQHSGLISHTTKKRLLARRLGKC